MQKQEQQGLDPQLLANCFSQLYSPNSSATTRKQADQMLISLEKRPLPLLVALLSLFEQQSDRLLAFQALVYFGNVLKRNWTQRRSNQEHADFEAIKRILRQKLLVLAAEAERVYLPTLFDVLKFVVRVDYPHHYPQFSELVHELARRTSESAAELSQLQVLALKHMREIWVEIADRKGTVGRKQFDESIRPVINAIGGLSIQFRSLIEQYKSRLSSQICKVSKYSDQILLCLLRCAPPDFQDEEHTSGMLNFLQDKLEFLLTEHGSAHDNARPLYEKNIKTLIYGLGVLGSAKPLMLGWTLPRLYKVLFYVITNPGSFSKNATVRYSLIGIRRIIKEFAYYADEAAFGQSVRQKNISQQALALRRECHHFYRENIGPEVVQGLLTFLLQSSYSRGGSGCFDLSEGGPERGQEKELTIEECVVWLTQALLQRFTELTEQLIRGLVNSCLQNNWNNLDQHVISNLLGVVAVLPSVHKKNQVDRLQQFPVLEVLQFVFGSPIFRPKFAPIVSGWLLTFAPHQLAQLSTVLLGYLEQAANQSSNSDSLEILMGCCQCISKILQLRPEALDLPAVVERTVPSCLAVLSRVDNPEILWPVVSLVASVLSKAELRGEVLVRSVESGDLSLLVQTDSQVLTEALCEMLRGFLCVLPRQLPAGPVHRLVCAFLNHHLSRFERQSHQKIFHLWYLSIREYSPIHGVDSLLVDLFHSHFRHNLSRKTPTLLYTLQEYLLAGLIPQQAQTCVDIIAESYREAGQMGGDEADRLKVAALSFQITLIARFQLQHANSDAMLRLILTDFCSQQSQASPTVRNSLLAIVNRYLIRFRTHFLQHLSQLHLPLPVFLQAYLANMQCLTSRTATRINAIATLSILNHLDHRLLIHHLPFMVRLLIPEAEQPHGQMRPPLVELSPRLRFGASVLSQRKEAIRREDNFEQVDLPSLFRREITLFLQQAGSNPGQLAQVLQGDLGPRLLRVL